MRELFKVRNPHLSCRKDAVDKFIASYKRKIAKKGFRKNPRLPILTEKASFELTTARNRNLISAGEQQKLKDTVVVVFGLSVGSHAAVTWMMQSRADVIKIIDPDTVDVTNLNRLRTGWKSVGRFKVDIVKEELLSINPFASVISFKNKQPEIEQIIDSAPGAHIIVDEIDDFEAKINLRKIAKKRKIPLISAADVGDNVIVDIERYDLDPSLVPFLGRVGNVDRINFASLTDRQKKVLIIKLVGLEHNCEKMLDSLFAIGASIVTWPQLGATAAISGGVITTAIKKIVLGENVGSGRVVVDIDGILLKETTESAGKRKKLNQLERLVK